MQASKGESSIKEPDLLGECLGHSGSVQVCINRITKVRFIMKKSNLSFIIFLKTGITNNMYHRSSSFLMYRFCLKKSNFTDKQ